MNTPTTTRTILGQALEQIFKTKAVEAGSTLKVTLTHEVAPEEFAPLAQLGTYLNHYPAVIRSGAGVSVIYAF